MRKIALAIHIILLGTSTPAFALTPLPDQTPQFFAGEWVGVGTMNQFCRIDIKVDGSGALQKRDASGTWTRQNLKWRNVRQTFVIDEPKSFTAENQMNGTFKLVLSGSSNIACEMQRKADFDQNLKEARSAR